jgi:hypothetical protein
VSLPPLPIVPSVKPQIKVKGPQAKPGTNDPEVRRATVIPSQRGRLGGARTVRTHRSKIVKWLRDPARKRARTHSKASRKPPKAVAACLEAIG